MLDLMLTEVVGLAGPRGESVGGAVSSLGVASWPVRPALSTEDLPAQQTERAARPGSPQSLLSLSVREVRD